MATYGAAGKNPYPIPNIVGFFSNEVNATTGVTQVYIQGPFMTQKSVGTYNPETSKFTPDSNSGLTQNQLKAISSSEGINAIKKSAIKVATEGIKSTGLDQAASEKKATNLLSKNSSSSGELTTDQQGASAVSFNQASALAAIADGGVRGKYHDNLKYPLDAKFMKDQDCIKFTMFRYQPRTFKVGGNDLSSFSGSIKKSGSMGSVLLPIQPSISDSNLVNWGEDRLSSIEALVAASALAGIQKGAEGVGQSLEDISKGIRSDKSNLQGALATYFAGQAAGLNKGFFTRATGAVLNENLELLFQGPSLRSFTFTFSLSAREPNEAEAIKKIIRFFKQGMSVKRSTTALFLKTPNIFDITYYYKAQENHPYINMVKTCALQNFVVNYTPAGNYSTFEDGAMTQYDLTMTFGEIEPLYDDDYTNLVPGGDSDTHIGF